VSPVEHEPPVGADARRRPWLGNRPVLFPLAVAGIAVVVVGLVALLILAIVNDDYARRHPAGWVALDPSSYTHKPAAAVYTRCDGTTRLYLTIDDDGDPVGAVQTVPGGCGR
jgi:hypothetical protein